MNIKIFDKIIKQYGIKNNLNDCKYLLKKSNFSPYECASIINKRISYFEEKKENFFNEQHYNKILCYETDKLKFFYITWDINALSKLHNHNNKKCLYKVLKGQVNESKINIEKTFEIVKNTYNEEDVSLINENEYHQMSTLDDDYVVTLHIYEK